MVKKKAITKKAPKKSKRVTGVRSRVPKPGSAVAKQAPQVGPSGEVDRDDAPPRRQRGALPRAVGVRKKTAQGGREAVPGPSGIGEGDSAPAFVLKDHDGTLVSSESLRGSPYLIYFYPKDDTPGCTLQACGFRDSAPRFAAKGVRVLGVSPDSPDTHARFRKKYGLNFQLLSDPEKTLAKAYGVWVKKQNYGREYMGVERSTFFIDRAGVIRKAWRRVRVPGHVDEVVHTV